MKGIRPYRIDGNRKIQLLDQRYLPHEEKWLTIETWEDMADAIKDMIIRGAPAIGIAAAFGYYLGNLQMKTRKNNDGGVFMENVRNILASTRPTAVNLFWALERMSLIDLHDTDALWQEAVAISEEDEKSCRDMGKHGSAEIKGKNLRVLTHCNAGALATGGWGTALGVIRQLHTEGRLQMVYSDETRPRQQGSRLTVWELAQDGVPVTMISDTMAGHMMKNNLIDLVITGADRIASNGDSANKIGTYQIAVLAKRNDIPFYIAAPVSTVDFSIKSGEEIIIEERDESEVLYIDGKIQTAENVHARNFGFDVTEAELISGIITEKGVLKFPYGESISRLAV
ncbi:MAG: S-methyl-5-thioribose-1-phosphate isomerase [Deltaproteobacteria bacterium]|nr:S-methyl-5-thioribose-1-phosphate isomerase [Deltaproteobacteria bacterium]